MRLCLAFIFLSTLISCGSDQPSSSSSSQTSTTAIPEDQKWRIVETIGRSGTFEVWLADDQKDLEAILKSLRISQTDAVEVDFTTEIVLPFTDAASDSCGSVSFETLNIDHEAGTITPKFRTSSLPSKPDELRVCSEVEIPITVLVAIERESLTAEEYAVRGVDRNSSPLTFRTEEINIAN